MSFGIWRIPWPLGRPGWAGQRGLTGLGHWPGPIGPVSAGVGPSGLGQVGLGTVGLGPLGLGLLLQAWAFGPPAVGLGLLAKLGCRGGLGWPGWAGWAFGPKPNGPGHCGRGLGPLGLGAVSLGPLALGALGLGAAGPGSVGLGPLGLGACGPGGWPGPHPRQSWRPMGGDTTSKFHRRVNKVITKIGKMRANH